jgi:OOP family OmpA-OmpF porin
MKGKLLMACAATALLFAAQGAQADGFYASFKGGMNLTHDGSSTLSPDINSLIGPPPTVDIDLNTTVDRKLGGALLGVVGYGFSNGLRIEGEVGYRMNGLDSATLDSIDLTVTPGGSGSIPIGLISVPLNGSTDVLSFMANVAYTFNTGDSMGGLRPWIGAGAGLALVMQDTSLTVPIIGDVSIIDDTAATFAFQAMAGVDYAISESWTVGLEYRFFGTLKPQFEDDFTNSDVGAIGGLLPPFAVPLEGETSYYSHSVLLGVTYNF